MRRKKRRPRSFMASVQILFILFLSASACLAAENVYELEPVVVTAAKMEAELDKIPANVDVLSGRELEQISSATTVNEVLNRVPGLYVPQFQSGIAVDGVYSTRGSEPTAWGVRILVNGIEFNKGNGYTVPPRIPMNDIERIEVIKGASAVYGDQAVGGVINIVTRVPKEPLTAKAGAVYGDFDLGKYYTAINGSSGRFEYFFNHYTYQSESYQEDGFYDPATFYTRMAYHCSDTARIELHGSHMHSSGAYPQSLTRSEFEADPSQSPGSPTKIEEDYDLLAFVWKKQIGDDQLQFQLTGKDEWFGYYPGLDFEFDEWEVFPALTYTLRHRIGNMENTVFFGAEYRKHELETRIWILDDTLRTAKIRDTSREDTSLAGYVVDQLSVTRALTVTAGARLDSYEQEQEGRVDPANTVSQSDEAVSPKIGAVYRFHDGVNLFGGFNSGFKSPARVPGASYTAGLDPERVLCYELGLRGAPRPFVAYSIAGFVTRYEDKWLRTGPDAEDPIVNAGETEATGVELGINLTFTNGFFADVSYTYQESEYEDFTEGGISYDGNRLPNVPEQQFGLLLGYEHPFLGQFKLSSDYLGQRYFNKQNTLEGDNYWILGLGYQKRFSRWDQDTTLFLNIDNLADEEAVVFGSGTPGDESLRPLSGRRIYGGIEFSF